VLFPRSFDVLRFRSIILADCSAINSVAAVSFDDLMCATFRALAINGWSVTARRRAPCWTALPALKMLSTAGMTWRCFATLRADGVRFVPLALSAHAASEEKKSAVAAVASMVAAAASVVAAFASVTSWLEFMGGGVMYRSTEGDEARAFFFE
jgi:hypothetical protein